MYHFQFKLQFIFLIRIASVGRGILDAPVILQRKITLPQAIMIIFLQKIRKSFRFSAARPGGRAPRDV